jgi:hypothetical protein
MWTERKTNEERSMPMSTLSSSLETESSMNVFMWKTKNYLWLSLVAQIQPDNQLEEGRNYL